jgi:hypothetical protein
MGSSADRDDLDCSGCRGGSDPDALCLSCQRPQEIDSKITAGSKKSAPFLFALTELQQAAMSVDDLAIAVDDRRSVAMGFWLRRRYEGPFLRDHKARPLALSAYYLLWELTVQLSEGDDTYAVLPEVWRVVLFGEKKHGANNWMNAQPDGMWHYEAALWRHIIESSWEERAEDSGCYHLAHAAWNALMLLEMEMRGVVNPDWAIDESAEKSCAYDAEGRTVCSTVAHIESVLNELVPDWHEKVKGLKGSIEITEV